MSLLQNHGILQQTVKRSVTINAENEAIDLAAGDLEVLFNGLNAFSVSMWIKPSDLNNGGGLFSTVSSGGGNDGVGLFPRGSTASNELRYYLIDNFGAGLFIRRDFVHTMTNDTWYHIVATYDGSEDISGLTVYQDAVSLGFNAAGDENDGFVGDIEAADDVRFGNTSGILGGAFQGSYSDITVWDIELSSSQVSALYNSGVPGNPRTQVNNTNLVTWLRMDEDLIFHPTCRDSQDEVTATYTNIPVTDITTDVP